MVTRILWKHFQIYTNFLSGFHEIWGLDASTYSVHRKDLKLWWYWYENNRYFGGLYYI